MLFIILIKALSYQCAISVLSVRYDVGISVESINLSSVALQHSNSVGFRCNTKVYSFTAASAAKDQQCMI